MGSPEPIACAVRPLGDHSRGVHRRHQPESPGVRRSAHRRRTRVPLRPSDVREARASSQCMRPASSREEWREPMNADLCFLTATELAHRIRTREVSVTEVVGAHLAQIERVNPKVNAVVTLTAERALADARAKDAALARGETPGPLFGLPVAHKDLVPTRGIRTTFGSPIYRDYVPDQDALLVER